MDKSNKKKPNVFRRLLRQLSQILRDYCGCFTKKKSILKNCHTSEAYFTIITEYPTKEHNKNHPFNTYNIFSRNINKQNTAAITYTSRGE